MASRKRTTARGRSGAKRATSAKKAPRARTESKGLILNSVGPSFTVNDLAKSLAWYHGRARLHGRATAGSRTAS